MTARAELPPALAPWAPALSALTPELAVTLGPMVRRLDDMISTYDPDSGGSGPLDGYEGLVWRGPPERLLASEWLLADELPFEFLRRAVTGELLYLAPARRRAAGAARRARRAASTGRGAAVRARRRHPRRGGRALAHG